MLVARDSVGHVQGKQKMMEIRMAWSVLLRKDAAGNTISASAWEPDDAIARAELTRIIEVANQNYGARSHWLEERSSRRGLFV